MTAETDLAKHYLVRLNEQRRFSGRAIIIAAVAILAAMMAFGSYTTASTAARAACRVVDMVVSVRDLAKETPPDWVKHNQVDEALSACVDSGYLGI